MCQRQESTSKSGCQSLQQRDSTLQSSPLLTGFTVRAWLQGKRIAFLSSLPHLGRYNNTKILITLFARNRCTPSAHGWGCGASPSCGGGTGRHRAYTGVPRSLCLFSLTCLDIKSASSALNTLGPSVSSASYWIGWVLVLAWWICSFYSLCVSVCVCAYMPLNLNAHVCP